MLEERIVARANGVCELCGSTESLATYVVPSSATEDADSVILACQSCREQLSGEQDIDMNHWRCLNDAMWSQVPIRAPGTILSLLLSRRRIRSGVSP